MNRCLKLLIFDELFSELDFCNLAPKLFASSRPALQRELLRFIVSNLVLKDKKLDVKLKMPFDMVAEYAKTSNWAEAVRFELT